MLSAILRASPDHAILLAVAGILLIYIELNRPGLIVAGAVGMVLLLLSIASLLPLHPSVGAAALLGLSVCVQILSLRRRFSWLGALAAGVGVFAGCLYLLPRKATPQIHAFPAVVAGLVVGPGTSLLTAIARRARVNKGLDL